ELPKRGRGRRGRRPRSRSPPAAVARRSAAGPRAPGRWRPPQRRRPLPLLAAGGDRRRPGQPPPPAAGGDPELGARLQHRLDGAHGQRLQRGRRAHRRPSALEPPRRHGHRPLPARRAPPRRRGPAPLARWARLCRRRGGQPAGLGAAGAVGAARAGLSGLRLGGPRADRGDGRGLQLGGGDHPVRLHPVDERRCRRGDRDVRLGAPVGSPGL
ncbi:MAG: probable RNA methyltransferase, partial [uncultured Friedmanniella sp.]